VLTKSIGRRNPHNVVKATIVALESLRDRARWRNARPGGGETLMEGTIKIKLVRSPICTPGSTSGWSRAWACGSSTRWWSGPDTPAFRGMVKKVPHLLAQWSIDGGSCEEMRTK
jgi:large subunit ribosomal protein L30